MQTRVTHRNPLIDQSIGTSHLSLAIDLLHCLYKGPALILVGHCIHFLLDNNAYCVPDRLGVASVRQLGLQRMKINLYMFTSEPRFLLEVGHCLNFKI